jgi:hypothetical protein
MSALVCRKRLPQRLRCAPRQAVQGRLETVRAHQKMLQIEQKLAKEKAETNGWNVTEETTAVTEQFCAAVKTR